MDWRELGPWKQDNNMPMRDAQSFKQHTMEGGGSIMNEETKTDGHRTLLNLVAEAVTDVVITELGPDYDRIAKAICSNICALPTEDVPLYECLNTFWEQALYGIAFRWHAGDITRDQALLLSVRFCDRVGGDSMRMFFLKRGLEQMTLGKLIDLLGAMREDEEVPNLRVWGSYRGHYEDLAFVDSDDVTTAKELLGLCKYILGQEVEGYKGGDFIMDLDTPIWISPYGEASGIKLIGIDGKTIITELEKHDD